MSPRGVGVNAMGPDRREIEAKFRITEQAEFRSRLEQLGAKYAGRVAELNWMFDTANRRLLAGNCGLRVRQAKPLDATARQQATLTYKGKRDVGHVKSREEIETGVDNAADMHRLLECLGFHVTLIYEKRRETWELDGFKITLDELPDDTCWSEIEGPAERLEALAA